MNKKLELLFENEAGRQVTISIDFPIEPVNPQDVLSSMLDMIQSNVITTADGGLKAIRGARLVDRQVETISLPE
ncbi:DUF2922 domain-containing protein [Alkalihalobacillus trypoxylicola]|uniref:DUF2922 domain-containing protein n=1 Tax=Alkalihalobacillus trypoxylicola TaxID=519424 RepID=A0A162E9N1_9BACI|nr:DUF2922 domain-containing protein [Alkalihalobacillus trypoxylicola]KYG32109.1 hypothetical protein AZF04_04885 [Alkalihalobacillus trypoxylicola]GAF66286.1 hypothetical protein BTS2_3186 [Bacillus sp. TS-2]